MKTSLLSVITIFMMLPSTGVTEIMAKPVENETEEQHNWVEYSIHYKTVEAGSHEYTYWKNFIERTSTCHISHRLKSVVYYCDVHDHTDSKIYLEETIHSNEHG